MQRIKPLLQEEDPGQEMAQEDVQADADADEQPGTPMDIDNEMPQVPKRPPLDEPVSSSKRMKSTAPESTTETKPELSKLSYQTTKALRSDFPARSLSVPASERRARVPLSRTLRPSSVIPIHEHASSPLASSYDLANSTLLYEDPGSRVTAYRTPQRDDDDQLIHNQISEPPRKEKVRVSLGNITIDIESSPVTPRVQVHPVREGGVPMHEGMGLGIGTGGRRITAGEARSTPGSSPVMFKSESGKDEEIAKVEKSRQDPPQRAYDTDSDVPGLITAEEAARQRRARRRTLRQAQRAKEQEGIPKPPMTNGKGNKTDDLSDSDEDEEDGPAMRNGHNGSMRNGHNGTMRNGHDGTMRNGHDGSMKDMTIQEVSAFILKAGLAGNQQGAFGPDTQALFEENEDLTLPNLEITPSPEKHNGTGTKSVNGDDDEVQLEEEIIQWIKDQASKHSVDEELVWWMLERTSAKKKTAAKALKHFIRYKG